MVDYTDKQNIELGNFISSKNEIEDKNVLYFAIAYSIFNVVEKNIADKNIISKTNPNFLNIVTKTVFAINELSPIDTGIVKNYIIKFAEYYNSKISGDFLAIENIMSIFNIDAIFGFSLLELVNKKIDIFKEATKLTILSKVINDDLKNKFLIGE